MDETENFIKYIKDRFSDSEIKLAKFVLETDLLFYTMINEKVIEDDKQVEKPTNVLELSYQKLCDKKLDNIDNLFEKIFLCYIGYSLGEYKNTWRLNLNNLSADLKARCTYCNIDSTVCPFKLVAYIKKCIADNNFDKNKVLGMLSGEENKEYTKDEFVINSVITNIEEYVKNNIDLIGAEMILNADMITIEKEEAGKLYYRYIDFNIKNNSFFNNLNDFYKSKKGIKSEFNISEISFSESESYIFTLSPFEIAVYIKYLCGINNINEKTIVKRILDKRNFKENEFKIAYYNQYMDSVNKLECSEEEKEEVREILAYIRNYYFNEDLPYIHFNIEMFTSNTLISDRIINIITRFAKTFNYIGQRPTLWVDCEMLIKRTKDSTDTIAQVENMYAKNDVVIFENIEKMKGLNEFRIEGLLTGIEKFSSRNKKSMTIIVGGENAVKDAFMKHPVIESKLINKVIRIENFNAEKIKDKIIERLKTVLKIDKGFEAELQKHVEKSFNPASMDELSYIDKTYNDIIFNKFKTIGITNSFGEKDIPEKDNSREVEEILNDINGLVGLTEVKANIEELIKYLEYSKKIDTEGFANLNMVFKGNSGTGKTTVARLLAELFYKLGFVTENKIIEVSSKDLIGAHIGETAPKTQAIIDSALDGVLFIDEAYTLNASKGGNSNYTAECMATISKAMDLYKDRLIIIFAGTTREMNEFINSNPSLMSRIGYEFDFPNFSKTELMQIFDDEVKGNEFTLEDGVLNKIENLVTKARITKGFGNARYVKNLFDRLVVIHAGNCTDDSKLKVIENKDIDSYIETKKDKARTVDDILAELNSLIGLKTVKEQINGFVSVMELNKKLDRGTDFNMHMIFKGNAGTGKTTVARLLSEIYYNLGYIKRNKLVEVQSQDLIGEFLGQTGPKTQAVIDSALDGVLFIDEAYAIMEHNGTNASYSAECVATLLKAMEDYNGRLIIIFAGYTEEMRKFRDLNPGLKSRVGYEINFDDYSIEELMEIYDKKVKDKGFKSSPEARKLVEKIMKDAKEVENFGNGRFVENTVQKIIVEHAMKTRNVSDMERLLTFTEEDIPEIKAEESRKRIGF